MEENKETEYIAVFREGVNYSDISNPDKASWKWEIEFKSPDTIIETTILNTKPVKTNTYTRVKK